MLLFQPHPLSPRCKHHLKRPFVEVLHTSVLPVTMQTLLSSLSAVIDVAGVMSAELLLGPREVEPTATRVPSRLYLPRAGPTTSSAGSSESQSVRGGILLSMAGSIVPLVAGAP